MWHYIKDDKKIGPVDLNEVKRLISYGVIRNDTLMFKKGLKNWIKARDTELSKLIPEHTKKIDEITDRQKKQRDISLNITEGRFNNQKTMSTVMCISIIVMLLLSGFSFAYYNLIHKPNIEKQKLALEKQRLEMMQKPSTERQDKIAPPNRHGSVEEDVKLLNEQLERLRQETELERARQLGALMRLEKEKEEARRSLAEVERQRKEAEAEAQSKETAAQIEQRLNAAAAEYDRNIEREAAIRKKEEAQRKLEECLDEVEVESTHNRHVRCSALRLHAGCTLPGNEQLFLNQAVQDKRNNCYRKYEKSNHIQEFRHINY